MQEWAERRLSIALKALGALVLLAIAARVLLPLYIEFRIERDLSVRLGVQVEAGNVDVSLLRPSVRIDDLGIDNPPPYHHAPALVIRRATISRDHTRDEASPRTVYVAALDGVSVSVHRNDGEPSNIDLLRQALERHNKQEAPEKPKASGKPRRKAEEKTPPAIIQLEWSDLDAAVHYEGGRRSGTVRLAGRGGALRLAGTDGAVFWREGFQELSAQGLALTLERGAGEEQLVSAGFAQAAREADGTLALEIARPVIAFDYDEDGKTALRHARRVLEKTLEDAAEDEVASASGNATDGQEAREEAKENEAADDSVPPFRILLSDLVLRFSFPRDGRRESIEPCPATMTLSGTGGGSYELRVASEDGCTSGAMDAAAAWSPDGGTLSLELSRFPFHLLAWQDEPAKDDGASARLTHALLDGSIEARWDDGEYRASTTLRFDGIDARADKRPLLRRLLLGGSDQTSNWGTLLHDLGAAANGQPAEVRFEFVDARTPGSALQLWSAWKTRLHLALVEASHPEGAGR
ncbi:MAG: hypothetical protein PWP23_1351 [Candidatus Sumerlaeota bacterium]|nr:hypothetical protein [Candidatus Sumerlaeota bacterium]